MEAFLCLVLLSTPHNRLYLTQSLLVLSSLSLNTLFVSEDDAPTLGHNVLCAGMS